MSPFSGLSAKIEADAADYNSTVEVAKQLTDELGDEAFEVATTMQVMASRTDEAGDEATELAASASAALAFGQQAADRFSEAESAAEGLAQVAKTLQSRIVPILRPLGNAFAPLIGEAVNALPSLIRNIVSAVGPLQSFKSAARAIGGAIARLLPLIVRLGADAFRQLRDELGMTGRMFISLLPSLVQFGVNVLEVLLPALNVLMAALQITLTLVNGLVAGIEAGIGIVVAFGSAINEMLVVPMMRAIKASDRLIGRLTQLVGLMQTLSGSPAGPSLIAAGGTISSSGGGATARRAPTTGRRNQARRGNPQARQEAGLPPIRVEGDTDVVKDVAFEGGQEGARTELERERRRTGDRR